jgi:hypothetical protein
MLLNQKVEREGNTNKNYDKEVVIKYLKTFFKKSVEPYFCEVVRELRRNLSLRVFMFCMDLIQ